jgi:hypothetical protein
LAMPPPFKAKFAEMALLLILSTPKFRIAPPAESAANPPSKVRPEILALTPLSIWNMGL